MVETAPGSRILTAAVALAGTLAGPLGAGEIPASGLSVSLGPPQEAARELENPHGWDSDCWVTPRFFVSETKAFAPLLFADRNSGPGGCDAVIFVRDDDRWSMHHLVDDEGAPLNLSLAWHYVGSTDTTLWAVLDGNVESMSWELDILHSADRGQTWKWNRLRKIYYMASFDDLRMTDDGRGRLTISLDQDWGNGLEPGIYIYRTTDFGATWSEPEYEPNELRRASAGPDPEQAWLYPSYSFSEAWEHFVQNVPLRLARAPAVDTPPLQSTLPSE